jgi:hypothetical protein
VQSADEVAQWPGVIFYRDGGHYGISRSVDDRDVVAERVGDIGAGAIRGYRHTVRGIAHRYGGRHGIGGSIDD